MNAPYKWIKEYCDVNASPLDFARRLTMTGSKVEGYENAADNIKNVVVCKILSVKKHPDADKLKICAVDVGERELQIVTAADNVAAGDVVPVALDGSELPNGTKIKKGKLRGEVSEGMFCSIAELCVTLADFPECIEDGIMQLPHELKPGMPIEQALMLDDTVFEFEITPNRPDCLCVSGLAREAAVSYGVPFNFPAPKARECEGEAHGLVRVDIEAPSLCKRYTAGLVRNVKIAPSPLWLRTRLRECGVRPICNIVDITNYVMLEYNQPMHAFDLRNVGGAHIRVRNAQKGEKITTLDDIERALTPDMLVIADENKPIAVAGVMGGEFSGIYPDTNTVVFESACFEGFNNRATSKALGLRTDSSIRFEKSLDPNNTLPALLRALELVELLDAGEVVSGIIDKKGDIAPARVHPLEADKINRFLGTEIATDEMVKILRSLEFTVDDKLNVTPPTFRGDIEGFADIAEEVARFYGYDHIPTTLSSGAASARLDDGYVFSRELCNRCAACGLYEAQTSSFLNPKAFTLLNIPEDSELRNAVRIINPFGEETSLMRTTALSSMLDVLATNYKARISDARLFELASEYIPTSDPTELPAEPKKLVLGAYGNMDFYGFKSICESILELAGMPLRFVAEKSNPTYHPGRTARVVSGERTIGVLGELHPEIAKNYGIKQRVYVAELSYDAIFELRVPVRRYKSLPKFPALTRDLALVCDEATESASVEAVIAHACGKLLESIKVFDVYRGEQIEQGKKSVAYELALRADDRTLTDAEADTCVNKALRELAAAGVTLRA